MGKKGGNTVAQIEKLARPIVEDLDLYLWDVRFEKKGLIGICELLSTVMTESAVMIVKLSAVRSVNC